MMGGVRFSRVGSVDLCRDSSIDLSSSAQVLGPLLPKRRAEREDPGRDRGRRL